jgi:hypothetical protein
MGIASLYLLYTSVLRPVQSLDSSIGIETGYGVDGPGSIADRGKRFYFHSVQIGSGGYHYQILLVSGDKEASTAVELYCHSTMFPWCGAEAIKHWDKCRSGT